MDPAHELGPLRLNGWVSVAGFVALGGVLRLVAVPARRGDPEVGGGDAERPAMAIPKGRVRPRG